MKRDIFTEIKAVKQRDNYQQGWRLILELKEVLTKFEALRQRDTRIPLVFFEYLPVSAIACFETYFRIKVRELLEKGEPYLTNSKRLMQVKDIKIDLFEFIRLSSGEVKFEDIVAHSLSFANLESINTTFSVLLNKDFFTEMKQFIPLKSQSHLYEKAISFKENSDVIFKDVAITYELRHIYCHEFNALIEVKEQVLLRCIQHCIFFLEKIEIYFDHILYRTCHRVELTNKQRIAEAKKNFLKSQQDLEGLIARMLHEMYEFDMDTETLHENLANDIALWKKYRQKTAKQYCDIVAGRENYWLVYWEQMNDVTQEKITLIHKSYKSSAEVINKYAQIQEFL